MKSDRNTLDLFDWQPAEVVRRYDEETVRTSSLRAKIARAVSETMKDSGKSRAELAVEMTAWLGDDEAVTENMLNNYASESKAEHTIPYLRLLALVHVTNDIRPLQVGAEASGHVVAEARYVRWIRVGMEADRKEQVSRLAAEAEKEFELSLRAARRRGD